MFACEFVEQILRFFTQHVDQYVQTTTVGHAQYHFASAAITRMADQLFQHWHQRIAAFQREAFCTREFGTEVALQPFCCGQFAKEAFFLFRVEGGFTGNRFNTLLDPAFFFGGGDVHIFRTDGAAVGLLQRLQQIAQLHRVFADSERTHVKGFLEISFGQIVISRVEICHTLLLPQSQRIQIRMLVATETVGVNQLQDFNLLCIGVRIGDGGRVT